MVAGGSGKRFGGAKQYEHLGARRVIDIASDVAGSISAGVVIVVPPGDVPEFGPVAGGETRSASVRAGLAGVPESASIICVHDAARPFATVSLYRAVIDAVERGADAAVPGIPVTDTIKQVDSDGVVVATPERSSLVAVQTPQAFRADVLRAAHATGGDATDDAALVEAAGGTVVVVGGEIDNRKITVPADLEWARARVAGTLDGG